MLGDLGFSFLNGTFLSALSLRTRNRELMLPIVLFPISIPALLAMILATTAILTGESSPALWITVPYYRRQSSSPPLASCSSIPS